MTTDNPFVNPDNETAREIGAVRPEEPCIHPGVFATDREFEHCWTCDQDIPRSEL